MEYTTVLASVPLGVSQNSQFFRPIVNGRISLSSRLLEIGTSPLSMNARSCSFWFRLWRTASSNLLPFFSTSSRSYFRKAHVEYSIPCWSARWPCTSESPPIEPAGIHPGFLIRHPFKSPFAPIPQIAEGQLFEIWEYYLILVRAF